ncbi:MAG: type VI secretion system baseplate subunit TssE [Deltaproteobacteria bacterium]|jgi:type VI secretion system protein|nr:type VI secretion system baseplate subunit TssE [Deltaproteobacteria bacterium]
MGGSLFERLTMGSQAQALEENDSIRNHLLRLLTTRQGAVQTLPDYGLPDLNHLGLSKSELLSECCRVMAEGIERYEPRLTKVRVEALRESQGPMTLVFAISGQKVSENGELSPWRWAFSLDNLKFKP